MAMPRTYFSCGTQNDTNWPILLAQFEEVGGKKMNGGEENKARLYRSFVFKL